MVKRPDLTLDQRTLIKVLYKEFGQDADQIREHESLRRSDGSKVLKKTVLHWINRIEETGVSSDSKTELVRRKRNTAYEKRHMQFTKLGSGAADVMVWGYCGPFGKGTVWGAYFGFLFD